MKVNAEYSSVDFISDNTYQTGLIENCVSLLYIDFVRL